MIINSKEKLENFLNEIDISEIAELTYNAYSRNFCDGVCQLDLENGKLFGCCFTTGETENPLNPFVELWRVNQNEDYSLMCSWCGGCEDCYNKKDELIDRKQFKECSLEAEEDMIREHWNKIKESALEQAEKYF